MVALILTSVTVLGLLIVSGATGLNTAGFVITTILIGFGLAPFVGDSIERHIPDSKWKYCSVSRDTSRKLGLRLFNEFLTSIGWNRLVISMRTQEKVGVDRDPLRPIKAAAAGHFWGFLLHFATATWAGVAEAWASASILLVVGLLGHFYPTLLQIRILTHIRSNEENTSIG